MDGKDDDRHVDEAGSRSMGPGSCSSEGVWFNSEDGKKEMVLLVVGIWVTRR